MSRVELLPKISEISAFLKNKIKKGQLEFVSTSCISLLSSVDRSTTLTINIVDQTYAVNQQRRILRVQINYTSKRKRKIKGYSPV